MTAQDLENSILRLAMQGKLVEQRAEEGTARELIEQIGIEKERLIKEGKIRKGKPLPKITEEETPFEIPESWEWVRLGNCISLLSGQDMTPDKYNDGGVGIPYLTGASNIEDGKIIINRWTDEPKVIAIKGNLLITCKGTIGVTCILTEKKVHIARQIMAITAICIETEYINKFLQLYVGVLKNKAKSMIPGIERKDILNAMVPLPPLDEQKRIVEKIEGLLPYIEKYGKANCKLEKLDKSFHEDIQKSILQYAMQGKLVEQKPEEGTGEELYWQIQAEKEKLIKVGKFKKEKRLPEITGDEILFDIPNTWAWVRVGDLFTVIRGSSPRPKGSLLYWSDKKTDNNWITIKDISAFCKDGVLSQTTEYLTEAGAELSTYVGEDELIIAVSGSTTGKHCVLGIEGYIYDGLAAVLNPTKIISSSYLSIFFDWVYEKLNAQKIGSAFPNINTDILKNTLMPLPPLDEQKRILKRLKNIMPYIHKL